VNEHIVSAIIGLNKAKTLLESLSRVTITRFHSTGRWLWEIARRRIQKGTAANRMCAMYGFREQSSSARDAALRPTTTAPTSAAQLSKQVLAYWEESLKTNFEYARRLALTSSLQHAANVQAELVKCQISGA